MPLRRYLSYPRARRAWRLLRVWRGMPARIERESMADLLPALDPRQPVPRPDHAALDDISDATILLVDRWRLPLDDRCLPRTLSLYQCLREEGLPVHIVFGVRPGRSIEEGHAWLEMNGDPVMEPEHRMRGFVPIFHHPPLPERTEDQTGVQG